MGITGTGREARRHHQSGGHTASGARLGDSSQGPRPASHDEEIVPDCTDGHCKQQPRRLERDRDPYVDNDGAVIRGHLTGVPIPANPRAPVEDNLLLCLIGQDKRRTLPSTSTVGGRLPAEAGSIGCIIGLRGGGCAPVAFNRQSGFGGKPDQYQMVVPFCPSPSRSQGRLNHRIRPPTTTETNGCVGCRLPRRFGHCMIERWRLRPDTSDLTGPERLMFHLLQREPGSGAWLGYPAVYCERTPASSNTTAVAVAGGIKVGNPADVAVDTVVGELAGFRVGVQRFLPNRSAARPASRIARNSRHDEKRRGKSNEQRNDGPEPRVHQGTRNNQSNDQWGRTDGKGHEFACSMSGIVSNFRSNLGFHSAVGLR